MLNGFKKMMMIGLVSSTWLGCSNSQFLKAMNVSVTEQNNQSFVNLSAEVSLGNSTLASLTIPVYDQVNQMQIGQVTFGQAANGNELITVSLDASSVLHADPSIGGTLPNGLPLPSALGVAAGSMMAFPILNSSRVYIGGDLKSNIVVGAALGIKGLDTTMAGIGMAGNIFFSQNFNASLFGLAGIYASPNANQNGIAVFGRYTAPVLPVPAPTPVTLALSTSVETPIVNSIAPTISIRKVTQNSNAPEIALTNASVSGVAAASGNVVINEQVNSGGQRQLLNYFYGRKKVLRPH